ncbi:MAG TPA: Tad domain-containing protein [Micromonosporaceae bacterium]
MSRLTGVLIRLRGRRDRGSIAVIVSVLLAGGVLFGMAALAIDVGQLYAEREQLQSGADAVAVRVAKDCATGRASCGTVGELGTAAGYAGANANDGASNVAEICGYVPYRLDVPCAPEPDNLTKCLPGKDPVPGQPWIRVRTTTREADGSTLLPPIFAQAVTGTDGTTVGACAKVTWMPAGGGKALALTTSYCTWQAATSNGTVFAPAPPDIPPASFEHVIYLDTTSKVKCPSGPAGTYIPGGFGWLPDSGGCQITIAADAWVSSGTGADATADCQAVLADAVAHHPTVVYVAIFDNVILYGATAQYHILGLAAFVITGYHLPSVAAASWLTGTMPCTGGSHCVSGYYVRDLIPVGDVTGVGSTDLGLDTIKTIG